MKKIKSEIQKICLTKQIQHPENSLLGLMRLYITHRKEFICNSTYKRYNVFFNLTERFEGTIGERMLPEQVDVAFIKKFMLFCEAEDYSQNTIYRSIDFIKTILCFAERKGLKTNVRELDFRRERNQKQYVTLSEPELLKIDNTPVPKDLESAKDWLLISCYTGQRISDFMQFSCSQLKDINGKTCIAFTQQKTGKEILLPLHPTVLKVISKNKNNFPPFIAPKQYNEDIRRIAKMALLNDVVTTKKRIGHRTKTIETQKWNVITSHTGRRSFATNFYGKIPTPLLLQATGHSTEQMFLKYINHADNERVIALGNYFEELYEKSKVG